MKNTNMVVSEDVYNDLSDGFYLYDNLINELEKLNLDTDQVSVVLTLVYKYTFINALDKLK